MTRSTLTQASLSREQILFIITVIEGTCLALQALIPILRGMLGTLAAAEKAIAGRKGK